MPKFSLSNTNYVIDNKTTYRSIYKDYDLPVHFTPPFMDAVCVKGDWDVILEFDGARKLIGVLVYHHRRYLGFNMILPSEMTAYNGIYILYSDKALSSNYRKGHFTYKVTSALLEKLPQYSLYYQQYHSHFDNWLALYWKGYKETTRYTYVIDTSIGKDRVWDNLKYTVQKDIKKAEENCTLVEIDMETYLHEAELAFAEKSKGMPANNEVLKRLYKNLYPSGHLEIKAARYDETGEYLSAQVIVKDRNTSYAIACFYKNRSYIRTTLSYIIWECMFSREGQIFDFEGSILEGVENYIRSFGGVLTPHYRIYKVNNPFLKLGLTLLKPNFFG